VRLDDLIIDNLKIYQRTDQFRFSIDAVMLAHFSKLKSSGRYVDLGTGTGVIPLIAGALSGAHITGIEINPIMADLAKQSVDYNHKGQMITLLRGDYRNLQLLEEINAEGHIKRVSLSNHFDGVLMNPPYYDVTAGAISDNAGVAAAVHESETTLGDAVEAARKLVKFKGKLWLIYLASRLPYVLETLQQYAFMPKRMRFVHSFHGTPAKLVLVEAVQGGKPGTRIEFPLCIYDGPQQYSEEVNGWYEREQRSKG